MVEEKIGILSPQKCQWPLAHCAIFFLRIDLLLHTVQFINLLHTVQLSPIYPQIVAIRYEGVTGQAFDPSLSPNDILINSIPSFDAF